MSIEQALLTIVSNKKDFYAVDKHTIQYFTMDCSLLFPEIVLDGVSIVLDIDITSTVDVKDVFIDNSCLALYKLAGNVTNYITSIDTIGDNLVFENSTNIGKKSLLFGGYTFIKVDDFLHNGAFSFSYHAQNLEANKTIFSTEDIGQPGSMLLSTNKVSFWTNEGEKSIVFNSTLENWNSFIISIDFNINILCVYLNGNKVKEVSFNTGNTLSKSFDGYIGRRQTNTSSDWDKYNLTGNVEQIRIFNRLLDEKEAKIIAAEEK